MISIKKVFHRGKSIFKILFQKRVYVSFGENCLTDHILDRHKLKSFATPYSHGRANIENILQAEKDKYQNMLNLDFLKYEQILDSKVPVLKTYNVHHNQYLPIQEHGIEFTHHDVIASPEKRKEIGKRIKRLQLLQGKKEFIIFYFHRHHKNTNIEMLIRDLKELKALYSSQKVNSHIVCFTQNTISDKSQRRLEFQNKEGIHYFVFHTWDLWEGQYDDIFWAQCDDDLIREMIDITKDIR